MPSFTYQAADAGGNVRTGLLEATSEAEAIRALEQRALLPLKTRLVKSATDKFGATAGTTNIRLRLSELLEFSRQLKVMLASGVSILTTLALLRQRAKGNYGVLLDRIGADIQRGTTLSEALAAHPRTFDSFYVGTIRAGEAAGVHTESLDELIKYYERRAGLRREIVSALLYPGIVVLTLIGACVVMLTCVVPQFQSIFEASGAALPLPTRVLIGASDLLTGHPWKLLGGLAAVIAAIWLLSPNPTFRRAVGRAVNRLPMMGEIYYLSTVTQFSRMLALLERSGLPLIETLQVIEQMLMPGPVRDLTGKIRRDVATGSSVTISVSEGKALPQLVEQMIAVGEETGRLDETLGAAAEHYEEVIRVRIQRVMTALEPLLTLLVSSVVMGVALAVFLPMWESNTLMLKQ